MNYLYNKIIQKNYTLLKLVKERHHYISHILYIDFNY
jgi:hypothetical protein